MPTNSVDAIAFLRRASIHLQRASVWADVDAIRTIDNAMSAINRQYLQPIL